MSDEDKKENGEKQGEEGKDEKRKMLGLEPVETQHELALKDRTLNYTARAGALPLKDDQDEIEAEIFFVAYDLDGVEDRSDRPLTFVFNGGPGSSTIWLHMGALGPKRVRMEAEGWMPPPPYRLIENEHTWLDRTDLVFVDPVGTGFSRAAKADLDL
jgi:carboxypeptidase C (cathepsin A)